MGENETIYAVTADGALFALIQAQNEADAATVAFDLFVEGWLDRSPANDHDPHGLGRARDHARDRLTVRNPTERERYYFAMCAQQHAGGHVAVVLMG